MANALYQEGKRALGNKEIDLDLDTLTAHLILNSYTFSQSHTSVATSINSHIATAGGVANSASVNLSGVSWSAAAVLDSSDPTFTSVDAAQTIKGVMISKGDTPIAYIDTGSGFPFTSSGGDITINWSASGIFQL